MHKRIVRKKIKRYCMYLALAIISTLSVYSALIRDPHAVGPLHKDQLILWSKKAGIVVQTITVEGNEHTPKEDIIAYSKIHPGMPVLGLDLQALAHDVGRLPWINRVAIKRRVNGHISISVVEHKPLCVFFDGTKHMLVSSNFTPITEINQGEHTSLPHTKGYNAPKKLARLLQKIMPYPTVAQHTICFELVNDLRWNLHLKNGGVILLPEEKSQKALKRLQSLIEKRSNILQNSSTIDLRIPGRVIIQKKPYDPKNH